MAASAFADSASLSFTDATGKSDPVADVGRTMTLSGNAAVKKNVYVRVRAAGGAPCAPSSSSDAGDNTFGNFDGQQFNGTSVNGNFSLQKTGTWDKAGTYVFCIWLADSDTQAVTPIAQTITFRSPTGTISGSINPTTPQVNQDAILTVSGASEATKYAFAKVHEGANAVCATSYDSDTGSGILSNRSVNGNFTTTQNFSRSTPGAYTLCLWLADTSSDGSPIAGPQAVQFSVVAPCIVPSVSPGTKLSDTQTALTAASCTVGALSYKTSTTVAAGRVIGLAANSGTTLPTGSAVGIVVSKGKPCVVPAILAGGTQRDAKARIKAAGCSVGRIKTRRSRTVKRGRVLGVAKRGKTLAPGAKIDITVSRGKR